MDLRQGKGAAVVLTGAAVILGTYALHPTASMLLPGFVALVIGSAILKLVFSVELLAPSLPALIILLGWLIGTVPTTIGLFLAGFIDESLDTADHRVNRILHVHHLLIALILSELFIQHFHYLFLNSMGNQINLMGMIAQLAVMGSALFLLGCILPLAKLYSIKRTTRRLRVLVCLASLILAIGLKIGVVRVGWPIVGLVSLAVLIVGAVQWFFEETHHMHRQIQAMQEMSHRSIHDIHPDLLLMHLFNLAHSIVPFDQAIAWLPDPGSGIMVARSVWPGGSPIPTVRYEPGEFAIGKVALKGTSLLIPVGAKKWGDAGGDIPHGAWLITPLNARGNTIGVIQFIRAGHRHFRPIELHRLKPLIVHAAISLENVRIRFEMRDLAIRDGLTGLLNHRRAQEILKAEVWRAERYQRPLSVLMLDVDSFKQFNDQFGHPQGDLLLRGLAATVRSNTRHVDSIARYGGEEFIIILPETTKESAIRLAERIRAAVEVLRFQLENGQTACVTVSMGVATYPEDGLNSASLVQSADSAMYQAKRNGKNRVVFS